MTTLAQLHDCHSCNDERSIVQKKKGVLVDLRRAGGLEDDDWWLAIYVMLTRARKLENLILLGMTDQVEDLLRRGPPAYLRELTDKLEAKGASTLERLQNWPLYDSVQTS